MPMAVNRGISTLGKGTEDTEKELKYLIILVLRVSVVKLLCCSSRLRLNKITDASVISLLCLFAEETGRKLPGLPVIVEALAALPLPRTRLVCAITVLFELGRYAFHDI